MNYKTSVNIAQSLIVVLMLVASSAFSQNELVKTDTTTYQDSISIALTYDSVQIEKYKGQALELVNYLEYNLNLLGSDSVPAQEKDIIINNSYLKLFKNSEVQIEDDLDDNRVITTNKDAQAYLKDIHFFFKKVKIKFDITEIKPQLTKDNKLYFKVVLNRNLKGINIKNESIESNLTRYIEINLDEVNQDLKIASIYSTGLSIEEDLCIWYNELDKEWKNLFADEIMISNSINLKNIYSENPDFSIGDTLEINGDSLNSFNKLSAESLKRLISKNRLDLSYNKELLHLNALKKFSKLSVLDISNSTITDISALRNISSLKKLEMGNTDISDIQNLKYCIDMEELYMNNSNVSDLSVLSYFPRLKKLYCKNTAVSNIEALKNLSELEVLQLSNTSVSNLDALKNKPNLRRFSADSANIKDLSSLKDLNTLEVLSVNANPITSIDELMQIPSLKKIYCNHVNIEKNDLLDLSIAHPNKQIIYYSEELNKTWNNLSVDWQSAIKTKLAVKGKPKTEDLHRILLFENIDVSKNDQIKDLAILIITPKLKTLNISNTLATTLSGIEECNMLETLNISDSKISDLTPIKYLRNVSTIHMENTSITSVRVLDSLIKLNTIYANNSPVNDYHQLKYVPSLSIIYADNASMQKNHVLDVIKNAPFEFIYRTGELEEWWKYFTPDWKELLLRQINERDSEATTEILHRLVKIKLLEIPENTLVNNFQPISKFELLEKISITKCNIIDLFQLTYLPGLKEIDVSNCPVTDISAVQSMPNLKILTLKNTPLESFKALKKMTMLTELDISGSQIKSLKNIDAFIELKKLNISNTYIKNIKEIDELPKLEKFICFNTKINAKDIAILKKKRSNLNIEYY